MRPFEPNEQRREDMKKLRAFVVALKDGQRVSWVEVTTATGIAMDDRGRGLVREALDHERRPYLALPGDGFEMSSPNNGVEIVGKAARGVVSALDRARETTEVVSGRHLNEMSEEDKHKMLRTQATLSAVSLSASLSRKALHK